MESEFIVREGMDCNQLSSAQPIVAIQQVALKARQVARQTQYAIVIARDDRISASHRMKFESSCKVTALGLDELVTRVSNEYTGLQRHKRSSFYGAGFYASFSLLTCFVR